MPRREDIQEDLAGEDLEIRNRTCVPKEGESLVISGRDLRFEGCTFDRHPGSQETEGKKPGSAEAEAGGIKPPLLVIEGEGIVFEDCTIHAGTRGILIRRGAQRDDKPEGAPAVVFERCLILGGGALISVEGSAAFFGCEIRSTGAGPVFRIAQDGGEELPVTAVNCRFTAVPGTAKRSCPLAVAAGEKRPVLRLRNCFLGVHLDRMDAREDGRDDRAAVEETGSYGPGA